MTLGSCNTRNLLLKHIIYLIYIYIYIYISPPPLHTAVNWLSILLGFCSLMCSTLLQRYPSVTGDVRMEQEGYSTQGKGRKLKPWNSWAPLKTKLHANAVCVCVSPNPESKNCGFLLSLSKQGGKRSSTTKQINWVLFLLVPCLPLESLHSPWVSARCRNTAGWAKPSSTSFLHLRCHKPS